MSGAEARASQRSRTEAAGPERGGPGLFLRRSARIGVGLAVCALFLANAAGIGFSHGGAAAVLTSGAFLGLAAATLALSVLLPLLSPLPASLAVLLAALPFVLYTYRVPVPSPAVPMEYSLLTLLMLFAVNLLLVYLGEARQRQQLLAAFGRYAPAPVVAAINRNPRALTLAGEARRMSVMFCDIRDFSGLSERLDPPELVALLNALYDPLSEVIHAHQGVIDKFMGDAVMAFWGAPVDDPRHAGNALAAAFAIQETLARLAPEFRARRWPAIEMGIGINTGMMAAGNMGSRHRMAYTVVGDAVNLAARLQELTRVLRVPIIVGEGTCRAFPALTYRELGLVQVRGKHALEHIYEPSPPDADPASTLIENMEQHNQALGHYYGREWDAAAATFSRLHERYPEAPLYPYYLERIAEFRDHPPPADWRGELRFSVK